MNTRRILGFLHCPHIKAAAMAMLKLDPSLFYWENDERPILAVMREKMSSPSFFPCYKYGIFASSDPNPREQRRINLLLLCLCLMFGLGSFSIGYQSLAVHWLLLHIFKYASCIMYYFFSILCSGVVVGENMFLPSCTSSCACVCLVQNSCIIPFIVAAVDSVSAISQVFLCLCDC